MKMRLLITAMAVFVAGAVIESQNAGGPVAAAAAALGAGNVRSIQYSGWGSDYIFGQAYDGSSPWPRFNVPSITIAIDYTTNTLRDDRRRAQAENPPLGGGFQPLARRAATDLGAQRRIRLGHRRTDRRAGRRGARYAKRR